MCPDAHGSGHRKCARSGSRCAGPGSTGDASEAAGNSRPRFPRSFRLNGYPRLRSLPQALVAPAALPDYFAQHVSEHVDGIPLTGQLDRVGVVGGSIGEVQAQEIDSGSLQPRDQMKRVVPAQVAVSRAALETATCAGTTRFIWSLGWSDPESIS